MSYLPYEEWCTKINFVGFKKYIYGQGTIFEPRTKNHNGHVSCGFEWGGAKWQIVCDSILKIVLLMFSIFMADHSLPNNISN